jgi:hypothetical protein
VLRVLRDFSVRLLVGEVPSGVPFGLDEWKLRAVGWLPFS